ncbi:MAG: GNAT family N-acetyltransferase [Anaerolineae bacterium]|nr:GNAT family N-acetyltransferase [Anaerolineae bacterium]
MRNIARITTDRLILDSLMVDDADDLFDIYSDGAAMAYWDTPPHENVAETRAMIDVMTGDEACWWAVRRKEEDRCIGVVGYLGNPGVPGMGYMLHPDYWQQGFMREAVRAALTFGFETLRLDRVELWINEDNYASQNLAREVGFKRRGRFRQKYWHHDAAHDKIVYGIRADAWPHDNGDSEPDQSHAHFYTLQPVLAVADVQVTAEYYRDKLGFRIDFLFGNPPFHGAVSQGEWSTEGVKIQLSATDADKIGGCSGVTLYIFVGPNIDDLFRRYQAEGVHIHRRVADYPWGMREFEIKDCNGYLIRFGTPI